MTFTTNGPIVARRVEAPRETWQRYAEAGADEAIVPARTTNDVDALVRAAGRW